VTHSENLTGVIFVMIGPGGAGKNAIMRAIIQQSNIIAQLATATTRAIREDEEQGREHLFISLGEFQHMIENNELLEYQEVTPNRFYGIPRQSVVNSLSQSKILIADIEVLGAQELAKAFPEHVVQIFVTVPGNSVKEQLTVLKDRMGQREDSTNIEERLKRAKTLELPYQTNCNYVVINDELTHAIQLVSDIIKQELKNRQLLRELS
jgi:guanylate kinase